MNAREKAASVLVLVRRFIQQHPRISVGVGLALIALVFVANRSFFSRLPGASSDLVHEHLDEMASGGCEYRDMAMHPGVATRASYSQLTVLFAADTTVAQANKALSRANVRAVSALAAFGSVCVRVAWAGSDFAALKKAQASLRSAPAVRAAALVAEMTSGGGNYVSGKDVIF